MLPDPKNLVSRIVQMHETTVDRWHHEPLDNSYGGLVAVACRQHQFNFLLWHEEDIARCPDASDEQIAQVKRSIDRYNQQRNNWIEKIDEHLQQQLDETQVHPETGARLNTETPGSAIDRLSIMALRIYHMREQAQRADATDEQRRGAAEKLARCGHQHRDLSGALVDLLTEIFAGRKRLELYRQMKMYNDPALNPYIYKRVARLAG